MLFASTGAVSTYAQPTEKYVPAAENLEARKRFAEKRFGVFIHWGLYAMFGQGEWYMTNDNINAREYAKVADAFYPHRFDAKAWVSAIKDAGAKYICFTTRHHDGFSMWNTAQSDYNIMNTPYGKDIVKQLVDECHKQDIGIHFYYSHLDWTREDYPIGETGRGTGRDRSKADWASYYKFMNSQLKELLTNYGKIDCIWFDGWWDQRNSKKPFDWQLPEQYALIHSLQPACLIGNNHHVTPFEGEDIQIFERDVPGENKAGLSGQSVSRLPLETCQTMNGMWGYKIKDQNYKSSEQLVQLLTRTAAKGANLLLNVGPQPNGELPAAALERFKEMGQWLKANGEAIYATEAGGYAQGDSIVTTRRGSTLYVHLLCKQPITSFSLPLKEKVKRASFLGSDEKLSVKRKDGHTAFAWTAAEAASKPASKVIKVELK